MELEPQAVASDAAVAATSLTSAREAAAARFEMLYAAYRPLLRKIAVRKFGIPPIDADDLVQDVFATYLANPANVRDLHPYLIGAICNASRQYHRRAEPVTFNDTVAACTDAASHAVSEELVRCLTAGAALSRLGERCRDTLERFYVYGETAAAIATSRETSPNYIYRLLNYCRNRVRSIYLEMSERAR